MTKKNLSDMLRQETEKLPDTEPGDRTLALQSRIQTLESELNQAQERIKSLESELSQAQEQRQALESELEQQQELVKKLYTNLQTSQEKPPARPVAEKKPPLATSQLVQARRDSRYVAKVPNPIRLSNEDIGWFD